LLKIACLSDQAMASSRAIHILYGSYTETDA
jgi:hypothetical protein